MNISRADFKFYESYYITDAVDVAVGQCVCNYFRGKYYSGHCNSVYESTVTSSCRELFGRAEPDRKIKYDTSASRETSNETLVVLAQKKIETKNS